MPTPKPTETPGTLRAEVFTAVHDSPSGLTLEQIATATKLELHTVARRVKELADAGALREGDNPIKDGDREIVVWVLARGSKHGAQPPPLAPEQVTRVEPEAQPPASERELVILVDGKNILYRAYYGDAKKSTSIARIHAAFEARLSELNTMFRPAGRIVCWDAESTWRHQAFPAYKAQRSDIAEALKTAATQEAIQPFVEAAGWQFVIADGFEADDILATYAKRLSGGYDVLVVSSDKDLFQCLQWAGVRQLTGNPGSAFDSAQTCAEHFGVPPERIPDLLALEGDKIDNIPGVPKVGRIGAAKLIQAYGDVEAVIAASQAGKGSKARAERIVAHADEIRLYRRLTGLSTIADLPDPVIGGPSASRLPASDTHVPLGMVRLDGELHPLPAMIHMADKTGWGWQHTHDAPYDMLPDEPEERWERGDRWAYVAWDNADTGPRWYFVHRSDSKRRETGTDHIAEALKVAYDFHADWKGAHPASPEVWVERWEDNVEPDITKPHPADEPTEVAAALDYGDTSNEITADFDQPATSTVEVIYVETPDNTERLAGLLDGVRATMADGHWRTLAEIHASIDGRGTEASISARLRDLRKEGREVDKRLRDDQPGLYEYRMAPTDEYTGTDEGNAREAGEEQERRDREADRIRREREARQDAEAQKLSASEPWIAPYGEPARGYAIVASMWAAHGLSGRAQALALRVDLKTAVGADVLSQMWPRTDLRAVVTGDAAHAAHYDPTIGRFFIEAV